MINDERLMDSFNDDSSRKKVVLTFDGFEISNENILLEEFDFYESLCGKESFSIGSCESSSISFKVINSRFESGFFIDKWFSADMMASISMKSFLYLIPYVYKNMIKRTFDGYEFTKESFDSVKFSKESFDNGIKSPTFMSLLPISLEPGENERYYVVNSVHPYIQYYQYDGSSYEILDTPEQPDNQISTISVIGDRLYAYHIGQEYKTVYGISYDGMNKLPNEPLTVSEKIRIESNTFNTFKNNSIYFEVDRNCNAYLYSSIHLGKFKVVDSIKEDEDVISIKSYDRMVLLNQDGSEWFNSLPMEGMVLKSLFVGLCEKVGIPYQLPEIFVNENMTLHKSASLSEATYRDILGWIGEASCSFPKIDRTIDDKMTLKSIAVSKEADYALPYFIPPVEYADYVTRKIEKLQVRIDKNDIGVIVGEGTNTYVIENNPLMYPMSDSELRPYVQNIFDLIKDISYRPCSLDTIGNPLIELGDIVEVNTVSDSVEKLIIPVLERRMTGIQGLIDNFTLQGTQSREPNTYVNRSINRLNGKISSIELSVDGIRTELSDFEKGTTSKFEQLDDEISLKVESEEVEQMLSVSLEGVVFKNNLTDGNTIISGSNIKTGSINADLIKTGTIDAIDINGSHIKGSTIDGGTIKGTEIYWGKDQAAGLIANGSSPFVEMFTDSGIDITAGNGISLTADKGIYLDPGTYADVEVTSDIYVDGDIYADNLELNNSLYLDGEEIYYSSSSGGFWFGDSVSPNTTRGSYDLGTDGYRWGSVYLEYDPDVSSDIRLKDDIKEFNLANIIDEVKIYEFTYKNDERKKKRVGILANAESLLNEHSSYFINEPRVLLDNDGKAEETFYSSNPHNLFYANIKATQEARAEIRKMRKELEILKKEIAELKREKGEVQ